MLKGFFYPRLGEPIAARLTYSGAALILAFSTDVHPIDLILDVVEVEAFLKVIACLVCPFVKTSKPLVRCADPIEHYARSRQQPAPVSFGRV